MKSSPYDITTEAANADMLHHALSNYGRVEKSGPRSEDWILMIIQEMAPDHKDDSTIAWCSIFMNYIAKTACVERTDSMAARSWLEVGEKVKTPMPGDAVIFWRSSPDSWKGHVGLFVREDKDLIYVLGGNQSNAVNIRAYKKDRLLGYRRLRHVIEE